MHFVKFIHIKRKKQNKIKKNNLLTGKMWLSCKKKKEILFSIMYHIMTVATVELNKKKIH